MAPSKKPPRKKKRDTGVDLSLVRWMLSLTPAERLQVLQSAVNSIERMRQFAARN
jgi:hypothetical protein